jgi:hypothetical protein
VASCSDPAGCEPLLGPRSEHSLHPSASPFYNLRVQLTSPKFGKHRPNVTLGDESVIYLSPYDPTRMRTCGVDPARLPVPGFEIERRCLFSTMFAKTRFPSARTFGEIRAVGKRRIAAEGQHRPLGVPGLGFSALLLCPTYFPGGNLNRG